MTVNIICETNIPFHFHYKELAKRVIETSLGIEDFPYECEVSLTLVDNARIHEINMENRNIDRPTDVLSFPMVEYDSPADFRVLDDQIDYIINPDTDEIMLGDIVISVDKVLEQAKEYGHSEKREYAFLITHSMLHLMGYDHLIPEDEKLMVAHQKNILEKLKINR